MNLYKRNTQQRPFQSNFRYQTFPQAPRVPEAPYSGVNYGKTQPTVSKEKGTSIFFGLMLGVGFLVFLPILLKDFEEDLKKAQGQ